MNATMYQEAGARCHIIYFNPECSHSAITRVEQTWTLTVFYLNFKKEWSHLFNQYAANLAAANII